MTRNVLPVRRPLRGWVLVLSTVSLLNELASGIVLEVEGMNRIMDTKFDWWSVLPILRQCIQSELDSGQCLKVFALKVKEAFPNIDWPSIEDIKILDDIQTLLPIIRTIFVDDPPKIVLHGIYFSIGSIRNPSRIHESPIITLQVIGSSFYEPNDQFADWAAEAEYYPINGTLALSSLQKVYNLAHASALPIGAQIEYAMSIAVAACILHCVLRTQVDRDSKPSDLLGVALGFDSGEVLYLGEFKFAGLPALPQPS